MWKNGKVRGVLQLLLSLLLLTWLLNRVGVQDVYSTLKQLELAWYVPAFLLFLSNIGIRAYRWFILLHALNERPLFSHLLYLYFVGFFANNFIPSGFGGDVVKVVTLRQEYGRGAEALSSVLMDRVTGLMGSSLIALVVLAWNGVRPENNIDLPNMLWAIIALISVGIPGGFVVLRILDPLANLTQRFPKLRSLPKFDKLERLEETVRRYPVPTLIRSLLISLPFTISLIFIQFSIARALAVDLPLGVFSLFVPIIAIINLLPISFNGLGVREGVYLFLFGSIGVPDETAVSMSLAFTFLRFGAGMVGGLLYALRSLGHLIKSPYAKN